MGKKINPNLFRRSLNNIFLSRWHTNDKEKKAIFLLEDYKIRQLCEKECYSAVLSRIEIDRPKKTTGDFDLIISIYVVSPSLLVGQNNEKQNILKEKLKKMLNRDFVLNIIKVENPFVDAKIVAVKIARELEKRVSFRIAQRRAMRYAMINGAKGCKISVCGRLGGAEIARSNLQHDGPLPLQTLSKNITYGFAEAQMSYGKIGVKVWLFLDDNAKKKFSKQLGKEQ
ncbi:MAG: 30S ribosomal protein S3 [Bacilli bacterium]|nr:30S ribosomal protein S3 [Bacilli bacterium]